MGTGVAARGSTRVAGGRPPRDIRRRDLVVGLVTVVLLAVGLLLERVPSLPSLPLLSGPDCTVVVNGEQRELSRDEARTATALAAVAVRDGVGQDRLAAAVAASLDGPVLRTADAADALAAVPAGARATPEQVSFARMLLGHGSDRLACDVDAPDVAPQAEGAGGLTPRAEAARAQLEAAFGDQALGGYAPGGVRTGHIRGSAHYEGRAVDVFFRPVTADNRRRGWAVAQWLVAHAEELEVATVIFDRQVWSARRSRDGWRPYRHPSGTVGNPVLDHLDHVHVDVLRG